MATPNLVTERLVRAMVEEGFVHSDPADAERYGKPNKRGFARHLCEFAGEDPHDQNKLRKWERRVFGWTSTESPSGMSRENAEFVAAALNREPDFFKTDRIVADLAAEKDELAARLERVERELGLANETPPHQGENGDSEDRPGSPGRK